MGIFLHIWKKKEEGMPKQGLVTKGDLAKRISKKYKNLNISDCRAMLDLVLDEILEAVLIDKCTVDLPKICRIGIKCVRMKGYDFKEKRKKLFDWSFRAFCTPNYYLVEKAKIITPSFGDIELAEQGDGDGSRKSP